MNSCLVRFEDGYMTQRAQEGGMTTELHIALYRLLIFPRLAVLGGAGDKRFFSSAASGDRHPHRGCSVALDAHSQSQ